MNTYKNIPVEMKEKERWMCYSLERRKKGGKMDKIPKDPHTGGMGSSTDPKKWSDFETAVKALKRYNLSGLGFALGDGIVGIDIDDVGIRDPLVHEALSVLRSYAEYSPSGKGIHIIGYGTKPLGRCRKGKLEIYDTGRFFTVTGNEIEHYGFRNVSMGVEHLYSKYLKAEEKPISTHHKVTPIYLASPLTDEEIIERASRQKEFYDLFYIGGVSESHSNDDFRLVNKLIFWTAGDAMQIDRLFRQSALMRDKWDRRTGGTTYGRRTIERALNTYRGTFYGAI
jgi:putative DNA primase/helicase